MSSQFLKNMATVDILISVKLFNDRYICNKWSVLTQTEIATLSLSNNKQNFIIQCLISLCRNPFSYFISAIFLCHRGIFCYNMELCDHLRNLPATWADEMAHQS